MSILPPCSAYVQSSEPIDFHRASRLGRAHGVHGVMPQPPADYRPEEAVEYLLWWEIGSFAAICDGIDEIADYLAERHADELGDDQIPDDFSQAIPNEDWYDYEAMFETEMEDVRRVIDEEWEGKRLRMVRWHESEIIRAVGERGAVLMRGA